MKTEVKKLNTNGVRRYVLAAMAFILLAGVVQAGPVTFETLGPMTTFLRADSTDTPVNSVGILLSSLFGGAIVPGSTIITLSSTGDICFNSTCSGYEGAPTFLGVFSSSPPAALSGQTNLQRISNYMSLPSGATGYVTGNTYPFPGSPTDIPEDFLIPGGVGTSFVVPLGAVSLYLGIADSWYADNSDPDAATNPLGVNLSITNVVPEPGTCAMLLSGLAGLLAFGRKRLVRS